MQWVRTKSDEAAVDAGCYFDMSAADRVRRFFVKYLRHSKGAAANKPFELFPWQWEDYVAPLFGWKMPDGTRRFRHSDLFVPKKNGKSTLLSGLSLYLLTADDEEGAEVYSAAADRRQASIIYNEACNMVDSSPALKQLLHVRKSRKWIGYEAKRSTYEALSADANTKEGLNIHALLFDEIHAVPDFKLWDALKYGGAARRQPLYLKISTAGIVDDAAFWYSAWQHARGIIDGSIIDISTLAVIYAADERDDWRAESTWRKANPSYDHTLNKRDFADECEAAQRNAADESTFKRYRLNIPVKASSGWIQPMYWDACRVDAEPEYETSKSIGGLDLAATTDLTAYVDLKLLPDCIFVTPYFWCPELKVQERERGNRQRFSKWVAEGYIKQTPTAYTDYKTVHDDLIPVLRANNTLEVAIDDWNFTQLAVDLKRTLRTLRMPTKLTPIRTGFKSISAATKELERLILARRIRFLPNPVLDWMFGNVAIEQDPGGNRKPTRVKSADKIDGIVAMILGIARFLAMEEVGKSVYETRGLRFKGIT